MTTEHDAKAWRAAIAAVRLRRIKRGQPAPFELHGGGAVNGRPSKSIDVDVDAFVEAHPEGATLQEIADACGVTREAVRLWEAAALESFAVAAKRVKLDQIERSEVAEAPAEAHGGAHVAEANPLSHTSRERRADAIIAAMTPSETTAALTALLDSAAWRATRASLALGVLREHLETADAEAA